MTLCYSRMEAILYAWLNYNVCQNCCLARVFMIFWIHFIISIYWVSIVQELKHFVPTHSMYNSCVKKNLCYWHNPFFHPKCKKRNSFQKLNGIYDVHCLHRQCLTQHKFLWFSAKSSRKWIGQSLCRNIFWYSLKRQIQRLYLSLSLSQKLLCPLIIATIHFHLTLIISLASHWLTQIAGKNVAYMHIGNKTER